MESRCSNGNVHWLYVRFLEMQLSKLNGGGGPLQGEEAKGKTRRKEEPSEMAADFFDTVDEDLEHSLTSSRDSRDGRKRGSIT